MKENILFWGKATHFGLQGRLSGISSWVLRCLGPCLVFLPKFLPLMSGRIRRARIPGAVAHVQHVLCCEHTGRATQCIPDQLKQNPKTLLMPSQ